jgi:hypothetical protein
MNYEYVVQAFDVVIALLGGFMSLLWDSGESCLESYQHYNFEEKLIHEFYTYDKDGFEHPDELAPDKDNLKNSDVHDCVHYAFDNGRAKYEYSYIQKKIADWLDFPLCCFNNKKCTKDRKHKRDLHEKNIKRLESEKDIANIVQHMRVSKFVQET